MNFNDLTQEVFNIYYSQSKSYNVVQGKANELITIIGKSKNIKSIDHQAIQKVITTLRSNNNSPATINSKLALLSKILNHAYNVRYISSKPLITYAKVHNEKIAWIDLELEHKVIGHFVSNQQQLIADLVPFAINTGMRIGEIINLQPEHIDSGYIRIWDSKNNISRSIPMNDIVKSIVKLNPDLFTMLNYDKVRYQWNQMQAALDIPDVTIHTLRHTFCSRLVQKGVPLTVIQQLAGHTTITTTLRYTHLKNENLEDAVNCL